MLLLGSTGQVGSALAHCFADTDLLALKREHADLSRPEILREALRAAIENFRPQVILNAAAYTAVDRAETEPDLADRVNHQSVAVIAEEAERAGATLVHYSTDYVFDGRKPEPWVETDEPDPLNVYGRSKLAGEQAMAARCSRYIVMRTSWVYAPTGHNFLRTMLRLGREQDSLRIVDDQYGAPTTASSLAAATRTMIDQILSGSAGPPERWAGMYHATCAGQTSWYGFAQAIFAQAGERGFTQRPELVPISAEAYPAAARRPCNSVLSNLKLNERFGVCLPDWETDLHEVMEQVALP